MAIPEKVKEPTLKSEIMLQINKKLLEHGVISKETYETAITRIVSRHPGD